MKPGEAIESGDATKACPAIKGETYAALEVREFPAQALLRLRPLLQGSACAVLEGEPPEQRVRSANARARALGVAAGMTRVELDTIPAVQQMTRSLGEELSARNAILETAGSFTPRVEDRPADATFLAVLDITGTEALFGPPRTLAKKLQARVSALGIHASLAISANLHAALCLARASVSTEPVEIARGEEASALARLPLHVLQLTETQSDTLGSWGLRTLGELAALPETALIARLGQDGRRLRQMARGEFPHLFRPVEPQVALQERMELDSPVEALESLLFVVGAMLEQLIVRATARVLALRSVTLTLTLERAEPHTRTLAPALASNDRALWLKLIHLDLEAHPPGAAVLALQLGAEPGSTSRLQLGLFSPQIPEPGRLDVTLARIRAIVGEDCVGRPVLVDTHRPDGFRMEPFAVPTANHKQQATSAQPRAAVRALRPRETIQVQLREERPAAFRFRGARYTVDRAFGPWLSSGEWWTNTRWNMQEWDLVARSNQLNAEGILHCSIVHDRLRNAWLMAGLYD